MGELHHRSSLKTVPQLRPSGHLICFELAEIRLRRQFGITRR
jgi:hypothetical protein